MPLGYLSSLVATIPSWIALAINRAELDINPPGGSKYKPKEWRTTRDLLQALDESVAAGLEALRNTTDEHLTTLWRLLVSGRVAVESPRHVVIADTLTHLAHHRGQLAVYLRLTGVPVPSIYGQSADDGRFA
jgi:uncharacterized damage-inducible protein DinB